MPESQLLKSQSFLTPIPVEAPLADTRGKRVKAVRDALRLPQERFAELLNEQAAAFGLDVRYDNTRVSKLENGRQDVSVDDLLIVAAVDPRHRGERWLGLGDLPASHGRGAKPDTPRHAAVEPSSAKGRKDGTSRSA